MSEYKNYTGWPTTAFWYSFVALSMGYDRNRIIQCPFCQALTAH